MEKQCKKCGGTQPIENFRLARTCRDGHSNTCRECKRREDREYSRYRRNRRQQRLNQQRWREKSRALV